jgi:hypothetical protein
VTFVALLLGAFWHIAMACAVALAAALTGLLELPPSIVAMAQAVRNKSFKAAVVGRAAGGAPAIAKAIESPRANHSHDAPVTMCFTTALSDVRHRERWVLREGVTVSEIICRSLVTAQFLEDDQMLGRDSRSPLDLRTAALARSDGQLEVRRSAAGRCRSDAAYAPIHDVT